MVAHKFHDFFPCYGRDIPSFFPRRYQCLRMLPHSTDIQIHVGTWFSDFFPLGYIISCMSSHMGTNIQDYLKPKPTIKSKTNSSCAWGLPWNVVDTPNVTSLKKTDVCVPATTNCKQLLGWGGILCLLPFSALGLCLAQICEGHTQLLQSFSSRWWVP